MVPTNGRTQAAKSSEEDAYGGASGCVGTRRRVRQPTRLIEPLHADHGSKERAGVSREPEEFEPEMPEDVSALVADDDDDTVTEDDGLDAADDDDEEPEQ